MTTNSPHPPHWAVVVITPLAVDIEPVRLDDTVGIDQGRRGEIGMGNGFVGMMMSRRLGECGSDAHQ